MATVLTDNSNYSAIAGAIRTKLGVQTEFKPSEMAGAINSIQSLGAFTAFERTRDYTTQSGSATVTHTKNIPFVQGANIYLVIFEIYTIASQQPTPADNAFVVFDSDGNILANYHYQTQPLTVTKNTDSFDVSIDEAQLNTRVYSWCWSGGTFE